MHRALTLRGLFEVVALLTGIVYVQQTASAAAPGPSEAQAAAAAAADAAAAAASADAASASASAAAAAAVAGDRPVSIWAPYNNRGPPVDWREPSLLQPNGGPLSDARSRDPEESSEGPLGGPSEDTFVRVTPEPTSPALPPGTAAAEPAGVDASAEDNSTLQPRLYLSQQQQQQRDQRQRQWLNRDEQEDVLLQELLQHTAAQAWALGRRQSLYSSNNPPASNQFLERREAPQRQ